MVQGWRGGSDLTEPLPLPRREAWALRHQEGKVGASASGRDMLWMAHCRMPSKECCGTEQKEDMILASTSGTGGPAPPTSGHLS